MDAPMWVKQRIRRIEAADALDRIAERARDVLEPLSTGTSGDALRGRWLGHALHPMLTDLPIGCWTSAALLDVVGGKRSRSATQRLIGLGLLTVPLTAASGAVDWRDADDARVRRVGLVHAAANITATLLYISSWRHRRRGAHLRGVLFGMTGGAVASIAGHLGGHMSFGMSSAPSETDASRDDADADADAAIVAMSSWHTGVHSALG